MENTNQNENIQTNDASIKSYLEWSDKAKNGIPRYILGLILMFFLFFVVSGFLIIPIAIMYPNYNDSIVSRNLVLLSCFILSFLFIPLITQWIHKRPSWSVAMPKLHFDFKNLFWGFFISTIVGIVVTYIFQLFGVLNVNYVGINVESFLPLLIVGSIGLFVQTSAEELLFRGYLTQFLRRITKHPIVYITITAVMFSIPHLTNIEQFGGKITTLLPYFISGLLYGWVAYKTGSLWMSIGLHWNNNLFGMLFIGVNGDKIETVAPFILDMPSIEMVTILTLLQSLIIAFFAYKYFRLK
ncbi:CPBP family intramembrane metalloprotease [Flavobacterium sp. LMO8]|uniref:CPBP family intramembrane glutamic endopeptidase n=1 Tax=Flavobacterium sp. LMO8 TaxID=2654244 RepID=UPI0012911D6D|nr:type II CAAX endopeptidase family protein [Flavobacterium sp. LMO8]MQP24979.1 CPBP family intramembrane metalloprotease [Flavobacterium sp. LMO8]